jgi:hypothetical protein
MQLFTPIVDQALQHPNFKMMLASGNGFTMDVINDWARGFVDRDGKFVKEFQTTFNSSFWELYLYAVLKRYRLAVDFSIDRPDFHLPSLGMNIEAAIASNAKGAEPEHVWRGPPPTDLNAFNMSTIIRLANALSEKHRKYQTSYSRLSHVRDRPFVVAVANFDQPYSFLANHRPIDAVLHGYYVDEERFIAGGRQGRLTGAELMEAVKANGSTVDLGLFTTPAYKEISAVMFNGCATMGKVRALSADPNPDIFFSALRLNTKSSSPHVIQCRKQSYEENLLDGLRVYHNPYALHPVDPAVFRNPSVFQSYYANDDWVYEQRDGQLLARHVNTLVPEGTLNRPATDED